MAPVRNITNMFFKTSLADANAVSLASARSGDECRGDQNPVCSYKGAQGEDGEWLCFHVASE